MSLNQDFFNQRRAGVLLHPTSLPGSLGNGDLGEEAYRFVDFIADCGFSLWQMLPLGAPHEDLSPYQCQSVHAANPLLISLDGLIEKGWLSKDSNIPSDFTLEAAITYRYARLKEARAGFMKQAGEADRADFAEFIETHAFWLEDYALFRALQAEHYKALEAEALKAHNKIQDKAILGKRLLELKKARGWWGWPPKLRDRDSEALKEARQRLADVIEQHRFEQFVFFRQWHKLKQYAHDKGVYLFGDIPIFVAEDSVDVWASPENFLLDAEKRPTIVTGVPPDYFSETGQRWGNPHYNWDYMQSNGFSWWIERLKAAHILFDVARIDHFRGFEASWVIPVHCETAINGHWMKVPGHALFETLAQSDINLPLVAEDLGIITDEVKALRDRFGLPGMKILQFAFDGNSDNPYLPHNYTEHCVVYTGTHDNNTSLGWFQELPEHLRQYVCEYLHANPDDMPWPLVESAFSSRATWAIIPMQDVLGLDGSHRMNVPGVEKGNWRWRFEWSQVPDGVSDRLRHYCDSNDRRAEVG